MADTYLELGILYNAIFRGEHFEGEIPDLCELILAARSGETHTQTNQATNAPNLNAASTWRTIA